MSLPEFNEAGDLRVGQHTATLGEVLSRFGGGTPQRIEVTNRLRRIYDLAVATGQLDRVVIFGSYVTEKRSQTTLT